MLEVNETTCLVVFARPRYLQILREFLGSDLDYEEEKHVPA